MKLIALLSAALSALSALSALLLIGCQQLTISQYDPITDQQVTKLQQDDTDLFITLQQNIGPDFQSKTFQPIYDKIEGEIQSLRLRVNAIPNISLTAQQVDLLQQDFDLTQQILKDSKNISTTDLIVMQNALDRIYGAILKLELAKKNMRT